MREGRGGATEGLQKTAAANILKDRFLFLARNNYFTAEKMRKLDELEKMSLEDQEIIKWKKANELVAFAYRKSPFYRSLYSSVSEQNMQNQFSKLPVLSKQMIRQNAERIATIPVSLLKSAHTSGTTGTPLKVYRSAASILTEYAYVWHFRKTHGVNIGDPAVSMRGALDNSTMQYYNKAENILYLSSYLLSKKNIPAYVKMLQRFKARAIFGYPHALYTLVTLMKDMGLSVDIPYIFTSSETLYGFQRQSIQQVFNGQVFDLYGNVERTVALGQCRFGNYHELPLYSINEFVEDGLISTSLTSKAFPLIRYFVDDKFVHSQGTCACGKPFNIERIEGRADDVIKCEDGTMVTGMSLSFRGIRGLDYAQVVQKEISRINVNIVTNSFFTSEDRNLLMYQLRKRLPDCLDIQIVNISPDEIIKAPSGKFRLVVSEI